MQVKVQRIHQFALLPTYGTEGAACFDIYADEDGYIPGDESRIFHTGLKFEIPYGYVMEVYSRSGHGFKYDVRLGNCVGIIDSDYRGELMVKLTTDNILQGFEVKKGDRIAQAKIVPVPHIEFIEVEELSSTDRGTGGLGSTGK